MAVHPDGAPNAEAAAQRRWLITIVITILFGGFGAVMAYLSYANSNKPAAQRRGTSASTATPPPVAPPAGEPNRDTKGKPDKGRRDKHE